MRIILALLFFLLMGVTFAQSHGGPKIQSKASDQPATQDKRGTQELPLFIKGDVTTKTAEKTEQDRKEEKDKQETDRWIMIFTGIAAVCTFLLVAVTGGLAFFTFRLWSATGKLVIEADDTAKRQLRGYVALETIEHDPKEAAGTDRGIKIRVKNYGETPAHHVSIIQTCFEEAKPDTWQHPATNDADQFANQMLHPDQAFNHFVPSSKGTQCVDRVIDVGLHQLRPFYVYGRIDYMDIYKRWWITFFCERYDPAKPEGKRCTPHHHHNYEYPIP